MKCIAVIACLHLKRGGTQTIFTYYMYVLWTVFMCVLVRWRNSNYIHILLDELSTSYGALGSIHVCTNKTIHHLGVSLSRQCIVCLSRHTNHALLVTAGCGNQNFM